METFHRDLLRAIIASFNSVLVYIIDDSSRSGTDMKYPASSAEARLLLREMAPRCCRNYISDRHEACGLPKHSILYDQPSAVVWLVPRCHGPSATYRRRLAVRGCHCLQIDCLTVSCSFCDRWRSVGRQWKGTGRRKPKCAGRNFPSVTWADRGLCSIKPGPAWWENDDWPTVSAVCSAGRIITARTFMVIEMWVIMKILTT